MSETHLLSNARRKKKRKNRAKVKPVFPSKRLETQYRLGLRRYFGKLYAAILSSDQWLSITPEKIGKLDAKLEKAIALSIATNGGANKVARAMVREGNKYNKKKNRLMWEGVVGVSFAKIMDSEGIGDILKGRLNENISLIKSVSEEMRQRTEDALWRNFNGQTTESLNDQLSPIYRHADNRVKTIARDQVSKFNAALNKQRQLNVGVKGYKRRTARDERVRTKHAEDDGVYHEWNEPPSIGHPGDGINCRCTAEPDIGPVLEKLGL